MSIPFQAPRTPVSLTFAVLLAACSADDGRPTGTSGNEATGSAATGGGNGGTGGNAMSADGSGGDTGPSAGIGGAGGTGGTGGGGVPPENPDVCASVSVTANRITPEVSLVVDGSGSMAEALGADTSRWQGLRTALLGQEGVVRDLQGIVEFGMTIYSTPLPTSGAQGGTCPILNSVDPALDNHSPIATAYPRRPPGGLTPTGEALQAVVDSLAAQNTGPDARARGEQIIVLATDGEPNGCDTLQNTSAEFFNGMFPVNYGPTEAAVTAAQEQGIDTYVISLAPELTNNAESRGHLQTVANLGQGLDPNADPGAEIFAPTDAAQLRMAIRSLVRGVVSCDVALEGELVVDRACDGEVLLDGDPLQCNDENGWEVVDASTIRLLGESCEAWKYEAEPAIEATFPCEIVTLE